MCVGVANTKAASQERQAAGTCLERREEGESGEARRGWRAGQLPQQAEPGRRSCLCAVFSHGDEGQYTHTYKHTHTRTLARALPFTRAARPSVQTRWAKKEVTLDRGGHLHKTGHCDCEMMSLSPSFGLGSCKRLVTVFLSAHQSPCFMFISVQRPLLRTHVCVGYYIHVLHKAPSGVSSRATGHEFNVHK